MQNTRRLRVVAITVALILVAAGCGSGDGSDEATDSSSGAETESTDSSAADSSSDSDDGSTTESTEASAVTGDSDSEWCKKLREIQQEGGPSPIDFNFLNASPAEIEAQFKANLATFEDWAEIAPPEIDAEIDTFVGAFGSMIEAGDNAGWDLNAIAADPAFGAALDDPEVTAAADKIDAYSSTVCGVDFGVAQPPAQPATGAGEGIVQSIIPLPPGFVSDEVLQCMNDELAPLYPDPLPQDFSPTAADIANFEAAASACGFDLS